MLYNISPNPSSPNYQSTAIMRTIRTIPTSSQSLAIDDLKRRTAALHGSGSSPTIYYQRLALPVSLLLLSTSKQLQNMRKKPPRPEPHTKISPLRRSLSTSFPLDLGEKHQSTSRRSAIKAPTCSCCQVS